MRFGYTGSAVIRIVWALIIVGITALLVTTLALSATDVQYPGLNLPRTRAEQLVQVVLLAVVWLIFGAPFLTAHEVRPRDVLLCQGILFRALIRYADIDSVGYGLKRPMGLGVRWYPDRLFVVTWPSNLVEISLKRPRSFRLIHIIPLPRVRHVAVNVDDPDAFLAALRQRVQQS